MAFSLMAETEEKFNETENILGLIMRSREWREIMSVVFIWK